MSSTQTIRSIYWFILGSLLIIALCLSNRVSETATETAAPSQLGYGFNVAGLDTDALQEMGFDWVKLFSTPNERLPFNVLLRLDATSAELNDLAGFEASMRALARDHGHKIESYEIGNEPNLDASWAWANPPDAAQYARVLCAAYRGIHSADSDAVVVSAGLAPTGRVPGNWNGHEGHNGLYQDERKWLKEFVLAGGTACADAIGYHPHGYRADFDATPDLITGNPATSCSNGFCFRGMEKAYDILATYGAGNKSIWATEYGWIVRPPDNCLSDPSWAGRHWQIVDEATQAANLVGSLEYAAANWPWAGPMFLFNHNFNEAPWYTDCEQMRFYSVAGRPAEAALQEMEKQYALTYSQTPFRWLIGVDEQPVTLVGRLMMENGGLNSAEIHLTSDNHALTPQFSTTNPTVGKQSQQIIEFSVTSTNRATGTYTATITLDPARYPATSIPVTLVVSEVIYPVYLPIVAQSE